jgi:hypothetical protein
MGHSGASLVRQMQEALRGGAIAADVREHIVAELHNRIRRLPDNDARFAEVRLSRDLLHHYPAAKSA